MKQQPPAVWGSQCCWTNAFVRLTSPNVPTRYTEKHHDQIIFDPVQSRAAGTQRVS